MEKGCTHKEEQVRSLTAAFSSVIRIEHAKRGQGAKNRSPDLSGEFGGQDVLGLFRKRAKA